jgi:hypothetical protein
MVLKWLAFALIAWRAGLFGPVLAGPIGAYRLIVDL